MDPRTRAHNNALIDSLNAGTILLWRKWISRITSSSSDLRRSRTRGNAIAVLLLFSLSLSGDHFLLARPVIGGASIFERSPGISQCTLRLC